MLSLRAVDRQAEPADELVGGNDGQGRDGRLGAAGALGRGGRRAGDTGDALADPAGSAGSSSIDRLISFVVADCSSTATIDWFSLIRSMIVAMSRIAVAADAVMDWMPETFEVMSPVARPVSWASSLTSLATTARTVSRSVPTRTPRRWRCCWLALLRSWRVGRRRQRAGPQPGAFDGEVFQTRSQRAGCPRS
ncbi:MAG: hypothetical protein HY830_28390 [Actinobacteria bacterium]|nr:hypothetical protein [Actinomycetota bacterium]